ncbi:hypothetical protein HG530_006892 [Fusarium avenaceum]|nr:hypothetical protein HG530_006892 [Fusarium avenaceum]
MQSRQLDLYAAEFITFPAATIFLILRIVSRRITRAKFWWDDFFAILCYATAVGWAIVIPIWIHHGFGLHSDDVKGMTAIEADYLTKKYLFIIEHLYAFTLFFAKLSMLSFYWRMFRVANIQIIITVWLVCSIIWIIARAQVFLTTFHCYPVHAFWDPNVKNKTCPIKSSDFFIGTVLTHVIIDIGILILPVMQIQKLQLPILQKVAIMLMFTFGTLLPQACLPIIRPACLYLFSCQNPMSSSVNSITNNYGRGGNRSQIKQSIRLGTMPKEESSSTHEFARPDARGRYSFASDLETDTTDRRHGSTTTAIGSGSPTESQKVPRLGSESHRESEDHGSNADERSTSNNGNLSRDCSVGGSLAGGDSTRGLVARGGLLSATGSDRVLTRVGGRSLDSGESGEGTGGFGLLSTSLLRKLASVVANDGDSGGVRDVDVGRSNEGAGDELGAGDDGGDILSDGDKINGGLGSIRRRGRSRSIAIAARSVTVTVVRTRNRLGIATLLRTSRLVGTLGRLLRSSGGSGRADSGALDDTLGDDLLGVRGRAVDDGSSTRGDGVDVSLTDGAGDHARSVRSLSDSGSSRGDISVRSRVSGGSRAVRAAGSNGEAAGADLSVTSSGGISVVVGGKAVVGSRSLSRDISRDNRSPAGGSRPDRGEALRSGDDRGETLRAGENSGEALGTRDDGSEASRSRDDGSESLRARDDGSEALAASNDSGETLRSGNNGGEAALGTSHDSGEALGSRDDGGEALATGEDSSESLRSRVDGGEALRSRHVGSESLRSGNSDGSTRGGRQQGQWGQHQEQWCRGQIQRQSHREIQGRWSSLIGGSRSLVRRTGSLIGRTRGSGGSRERSRLSQVTTGDSNGTRELDRLGDASGNRDVDRSATSSSDDARSGDGRGVVGALVLVVVDELAASTTGGLVEGRLDTLGETDGEVGDETEEITSKVELLVDSETEVAAELTGDIDTGTATSSTANGSTVVEEGEPDTTTEANLSGALATETENRNVETTTDGELGTKTETKLEVDTSTEINIGTDANGESLGDKTLERSVDDLLGEQRDVDVGGLGELDVDTSREVDGLATTDNEIDGDGSVDSSLQISVKTGDGNTNLGSSVELDSLVDRGRGREIDLDVGRDATETDTDVGSGEEVSSTGEANVTRELAAGEVEAEVDSRRGRSLRGTDTLEEDVVLPGVADAARGTRVPVTLATSIPLDATTEKTAEAASKMTTKTTAQVATETGTKTTTETGADTSTKTDSGTKTDTSTDATLAAAADLTASAALDITLKVTSSRTAGTTLKLAAGSSTSTSTGTGTKTDASTEANASTNTGTAANLTASTSLKLSTSTGSGTSSSSSSSTSTQASTSSEMSTSSSSDLTTGSSASSSIGISTSTSA